MTLLKPFFLFYILSRVEPLFAYTLKHQSRATRLPTKLLDVSDKLVFDTKTGQFFERDLDAVCEEEFCLVDNESGEPILLTREEKERIFLDALQMYYATGKSNLPNDQFDRLKSDLSWEGSALVVLNRNEIFRCQNCVRQGHSNYVR